MVLTRRGSRSVNSIGNDDDDGTDSFMSARRSARGVGAPPPPPPPPRRGPSQPPPLDPPQQHVSMAANDDDGGAIMMAPIPEEVQMNNNNSDNNSGESSEVSVAERNNNTVEEANNNNNNNMQAPPPPMQYLHVRTPPPFQSLLRPSRIRRRHHHQHHRPPNNNHAPNAIQSRSRKGSRGQRQYHPSNNEGEIVRVLIPPNGFASERQLAECMSQAGAADVPLHDAGRWNEDFGDDDDYSMGDFFGDRDSVHVAGMFTEKDRVFIPLSIIYSNPTSFVNEVLCLKRPPSKRPVQVATGGTTKRGSIFIIFLEIFGIATVAAASWWSYGAAQLIKWDYVLDEATYKIERFFFAILNFPFWLFDAVIEFPLREIYRHGPSVLGWEGEPLPRICARVTYHGDESFWSRNIEECEQIYKTKELAAMQVRKPIVIGFIILVLFYMAKSIVAARALRRRERIDPNMVETYQAIQMLTRQLRRAVNAR
mmetsp:Transcript_2981/g.5296  ORF Transcript_2981/g.5296 Transcript_2981/m.5296 type:complete len:481 (-) Transcript_2981:123-1565(-)|eukprot:CAMPEP_0201659556 /NCGR_PEP_ID=MMETSP0494-20130426/2348_1 /ASSEMBLY_ACC=CAM_ASM_000839 /TAXON_ID=420259 /ORGANISM="Thalassiosira gravida, Strain GMp14c1" /LENGTH=480 /DNA_ID=CAMNT_0048137101 /DNA_START=51 /DNA_END=1493 /DNA_ORIENTATION=+